MGVYLEQRWSGVYSKSLEDNFHYLPCLLRIRKDRQVSSSNGAMCQPTLFRMNAHALTSGS